MTITTGNLSELGACASGISDFILTFNAYRVEIKEETLRQTLEIYYRNSPSRAILDLIWLVRRANTELHNPDLGDRIDEFETRITKECGFACTDVRMREFFIEQTARLYHECKHYFES